MSEGIDRRTLAQAFVREWVAAVLAGSVCFFVLTKILEIRHDPNLELPTEVIKTIVTVSFSLGITFAVKLLMIRRPILSILTQVHETDPKLRGLIILLIRDQIEGIGDYRQALGKGGISLEKPELDTLSQACFTANHRRNYVGTESNVPTRFLDLFPTYLEFQTRRLADRADARDVRILFATPGELQADYTSDPVRFQLFYDWHWSHGFRLLQAEKTRAATLADQLELPSTDIAIFGGQYALFFFPQGRAGAKGAGTKVLLRPINDALQLKLSTYLRQLDKECREIRLEKGVVLCKKRPDEDAKGDLDRLLWDLR
jgi:hypothetical protein